MWTFPIFRFDFRSLNGIVETRLGFVYAPTQYPSVRWVLEKRSWPIHHVQLTNRGEPRLSPKRLNRDGKIVAILCCSSQLIMRLATIDSLGQASTEGRWFFGYMKTLSSGNTFTALYILLRVTQKLTPVLIGLRSLDIHIKR